MAKKIERAHAKKLYMEGRPQKDIAKLLNVTEKTISRWANAEKWNSIRAAKSFSNTELAQNKIKELLFYSELRLDLMKDLEAMRELPEEERDKEEMLNLVQQIAKLADAAAKTDKQGDKLQKENRITLVTYLEVMDSIFKALQSEDEKLHNLTLDFQERHVLEVAKNIG